jgi:uncharacterized membrane protein
MTQKEYLLELEQEIELLDAEIAEEVLDHYQARFRDASRYENKTDAEVIIELGTPRQLAKRIYESYGIKDSVWTSARDANLKLSQVVLVLAFDLLIASWMIPLMIFLVLTGFASFITFPFVITALPGLVLQDAILVVILAIGAYSLLLLFALGLAELGVLLIKNILILNFRILTPQNRTTTRLLKNLSLFSWMRQVKLGRNIFINLGMIGLTLVSVSFLFLLNTGTQVGDIFGVQPEITQVITEDLQALIDSEDIHDVVIQIGNADVRLLTNPTSQMTITREYNLQDGYRYSYNQSNKTLFITTTSEVIDEGFFRTYNASYTISLPEELFLGGVTVRVTTADVDVEGVRADDISITQETGEIFMYDVDAVEAEIFGSNSVVRLLDSYIQVVNIQVDRGFVRLDRLNDIISDGLFMTVATNTAIIDVEDSYFRNYDLASISTNIFLQNANLIYEPESMRVTSVDGIVTINESYESLLPVS